MSILTVDIQEVKENLDSLLAQVSEGTEFVLVKGDKPVARLLPLSTLPPRVLGLDRGAITMREDFDDPLPDAFWFGKDE